MNLVEVLAPGIFHEPGLPYLPGTHENERFAILSRFPVGKLNFYALPLDVEVDLVLVLSTRRAAEGYTLFRGTPDFSACCIFYQISDLFGCCRTRRPNRR